jgi:hypothetical protein
MRSIIASALLVSSMVFAPNFAYSDEWSNIVRKKITQKDNDIAFALAWSDDACSRPNVDRHECIALFKNIVARRVSERAEAVSLVELNDRGLAVSRRDEAPPFAVSAGL